MSQKSNTRKSQRGGVSHHEMKRGLNNWERHKVLIESLRTPQERFSKKELPSSSADLPASKDTLTDLNSPTAHAFENLPKKRNRALVM